MNLYRVAYVHRQNLKPTDEDRHIGVTEKVAFVVAETDTQATAHVARDPHHEVMGARLMQSDVSVAGADQQVPTQQWATSKRSKRR